VATEPLSTNDISKKIAFSKGLDSDGSFDGERFQKSILSSLSRCEESGLIERVGRDGLTVLWQIKA
jgi:hypothetical protein